MKKAIIIILSVLAIDQISKIYIKTHMYLGQEFHIFGNWFIIHFTENNGMAFGFELDWQYGKLLLSIFRIIAVIGIAWYLWRLIKDKQSSGLLISSISLVFAGALGNIIDSALYGVLFSDSGYQIATFLPKEGGYAALLHGKVVDMLYFPIIETHFPDWFPIWANQEFVFFRPVFNIADSAVSIGVFLLLLANNGNTYSGQIKINT